VQPYTSGMPLRVLIFDEYLFDRVPTLKIERSKLYRRVRDGEEEKPNINVVEGHD
jgi:hypothetical protein